MIPVGLEGMPPDTCYDASNYLSACQQVSRHQPVNSPEMVLCLGSTSMAPGLVYSATHSQPINRDKDVQHEFTYLG
jgi:hypothetical protein